MKLPTASPLCKGAGSFPSVVLAGLGGRRGGHSYLFVDWCLPLVLVALGGHR